MKLLRVQATLIKCKARYLDWRNSQKLRQEGAGVHAMPNHHRISTNRTHLAWAPTLAKLSWPLNQTSMTRQYSMGTSLRYSIDRSKTKIKADFSTHPKLMIEQFCTSKSSKTSTSCLRCRWLSNNLRMPLCSRVNPLRQTTRYTIDIQSTVISKTLQWCKVGEISSTIPREQTKIIAKKWSRTIWLLMQLWLWQETLAISQTMKGSSSSTLIDKLSATRLCYLTGQKLSRCIITPIGLLLLTAKIVEAYGWQQKKMMLAWHTSRFIIE